MSKKAAGIIALIVVIAAAVFIMSSDNGQKAGDAPQSKTRDGVRISIYAEPTGLDPQNAEDTNSQRVHKNITEALVNLNEEMEYVPGLAEKWEISPDGLTYTFYLKKDVKAHNGDTLTAEDVRYTFERGSKSAKVEKAFRSIESMEVLDDNTIRLKLKYVSPVTLGYLSSPSAGIVNKRAAEELGDAAFNKSPVGYGPYKFVKWDSGAKVTLEAFGDYHGGKPAIDRAEFIIMPDASTAAIALEKDEIDIFPEVSTTDVAKLSTLDTITVHKGPSLIGTLFHMNCLRKPFDDARVRQAINYAVDKEDVVTVALDGIGGTIMQSYIPEQSLAKKSDTVAYPYDPDKAKELLKEAGLPDGFAFTISTQQGTNEKIAQVIQESLGKIGITVKIDIHEWGSLLALTANDQYDATIMRIVAMIPDPDLSLYTRFHSSEANNFSNYRDKKMDEMLDEARTCPDPEKRTDLYLEIGDYLKEQAPAVPLFYKEIIDATNKDLKGYKTDPRNFISLEKLSW